MGITPFIIFAIIMTIGIVVALVFFISANNKPLNFAEVESESQRLGENELNTFINDKFGMCIEHLDDKRVLGVNYVYYIPSMKEYFKSAGKDLLRSAMTLGTVKYTTVETPTPLLLTADGLHIFDLSVEGKVKRHLMFNNSRLENATLTPLPDEQAPKLLVDCAKFYNLQVPCEDQVREIKICTVVYTPTEQFFNYNKLQRVLAYAAGKEFFKALEEKYPNLKT